MDIYINNEKTTYELENEKDSFDIVTAIGDFVGKLEPKNFITNLVINEKEYSLDDEKKLREIKIDNIKKISVETGDVFGITTLTITQVENFIDIIKNIMQKKTGDIALNNLDDSLKWMNEGLKQILKIYNPNDENINTEINDFFENLDNFRNFMSSKSDKNFFENENNSKEALMFIDIMKAKIKNIKKWLVYSYRLPDRDFIYNNLNEIISNIEDLVPRLQNVPILFQTGEDKDAMNTIQFLTNILEECIGLFVLFKEKFVVSFEKFVIKEIKFDDFFKGVTVHLKELMEAIQNNDFVMVGDLLEYEFVPNIEEIKNILIKIKEEAFIKAN